MASIAISAIIEIAGTTIATVGIITVAGIATGDPVPEATLALAAHMIDATTVIHQQSHHLHHRRKHHSRLKLLQHKIKQNKTPEFRIKCIHTS